MFSETPECQCLQWLTIPRHLSFDWKKKRRFLKINFIVRSDTKRRTNQQSAGVLLHRPSMVPGLFLGLLSEVPLLSSHSVSHKKNGGMVSTSFYPCEETLCLSKRLFFVFGFFFFFLIAMQYLLVLSSRSKPTASGLLLGICLIQQGKNLVLFIYLFYFILLRFNAMIKLLLHRKTPAEILYMAHLLTEPGLAHFLEHFCFCNFLLLFLFLKYLK